MLQEIFDEGDQKEVKKFINETKGANAEMAGFKAKLATFGEKVLSKRKSGKAAKAALKAPMGV
eukprot:7700177-Lingulodinium_polyedra.AAC.1